MSEPAISKPSHRRNQAQQDVPPAMIIARLKLAGRTLRSMSIAAGYLPQSLYDTLYGRSRRGEALIARALKCDPRELWPSRYSNLKSASPRMTKRKGVSLRGKNKRKGAPAMNP